MRAFALMLVAGTLALAYVAGTVFVEYLHVIGF